MPFRSPPTTTKQGISCRRSRSARCLPEERHAIRPWLFRILRNLWIDEYRRSKHRAFDTPLHELPAQSFCFEDALIAEITVRQGMARIDATHREIIELIDLAGFSYAEVSGVLDVPIGTVMSRLSRARLALLHAIRAENVLPIGSRRASQ